MCYKTEKHRDLRKKLDVLMKKYPIFIRGYFAEQKSARSSYNYFGYIEQMLNWCMKNSVIEKDSISEINESDFENILPASMITYFSELYNSGNSLSTINSKINVCRSFWSYLVRNKHVKENIVSSIKKDRFKTERKEDIVKVPTKKELNEFLNNIKLNGENYSTSRNFTMVKVLLGSGIRSEELIGLDIHDLYLDGEDPHITVMGKGNIEEKEKVRISLEAKEHLVEYLTQRSKFLDSMEIDTDALFLSSWKKRISKSGLDKIFSVNSDKKITPHMIRHYVGTMIYRATKDIILVQAQLRHAKLETAVKFYVQKDEKKLRNVLNVL